MTQPKKHPGRNKYPMLPLRADEDGQLEHWKEFAERHVMTLSELIRKAVDKFTGRKSAKK